MVEGKAGVKPPAETSATCTGLLLRRGSMVHGRWLQGFKGEQDKVELGGLPWKRGRKASLYAGNANALGTRGGADTVQRVGTRGGAAGQTGKGT